MHKILESELLSADVVLYIKYKINANISYSADAITWESFVFIFNVNSTCTILTEQFM